MRVWVTYDEYERAFLSVEEPGYPQLVVNLPEELVQRFDLAVAELEAAGAEIEDHLREQGATADLNRRREEYDADNRARLKDAYDARIAANKKEHLGL